MPFSPRSSRSRAARQALRVLSPVARGGALCLLPFWVLVRGSVFAEHHLELNAWLALGVGSGLATLALAVPVRRVWRRLTGRDRSLEIASRVVLPAVLVFSVAMLVSVSAPNTKSERLQELYTSLHPVLRVGLGTAILADPGTVITDIERRPADYARLGLSPVARSLHYTQPDGWVHAVDLRTRGRSGLRNALYRFYFWLVGFDTIRHTGNADHLHVALPF